MSRRRADDGEPASGEPDRPRAGLLFDDLAAQLDSLPPPARRLGGRRRARSRRPDARLGARARGDAGARETGRSWPTPATSRTPTTSSSRRSRSSTATAGARRTVPRRLGPLRPLARLARRAGHAHHRALVRAHGGQLDAAAVRSAARRSATSTSPSAGRCTRAHRDDAADARLRRRRGRAPALPRRRRRDLRPDLGGAPGATGSRAAACPPGSGSGLGAALDLRGRRVDHRAGRRRRPPPLATDAARAARRALGDDRCLRRAAARRLDDVRGGRHRAHRRRLVRHARGRRGRLLPHACDRSVRPECKPARPRGTAFRRQGSCRLARLRAVHRQPLETA